MGIMWYILTYLTDGCAISILLFLIGSIFIPALRSLRPSYLRMANTIFAIAGLVALGISIFLYSIVVIELLHKEEFKFYSFIAKRILAGVVLLGIVPLFAFSRKCAINIGFTCVLLISITLIVHADLIAQQLVGLSGFNLYNSFWQEVAAAKWYRIAFALLFFLLCYWFARRKVNRPAQS